MALISSTIPNMIGGISQQPATIRMKTQGSDQINGYADVVDGLKKRPGTEHVAKISTSALTGAFIHALKRDETEAYIVVFTGTGTNVTDRIKVFDKNGVAKTVNVKDSSGSTVTSGTLYDAVKTYLAAGTPSTSFAATTIADYTFVLNKTIVAAKSATVGSKRNPEALVYITTGDYATTYKIQVKKTSTSTWATAAELTTKDSYVAGGSGTAGDGIYEKVLSTSTIASELTTDPSTEVSAASDPTSLNETLGNATWLGSNFSNGGFTVSQFGSTIHIKSTKNSSDAVVTDGTAQDFDIRVQDSRGNVFVRVFKDSTPSFTKLPGHADEEAKDMVLKITGDSAKFQDNFFVKLSEAEKGIWEETIGPGLQNTLDASTLPIQLVKETDGSFTLQQTAWNLRVAGDDETNEFPSFIGKKINDIIFFQNRLGVIADENVIFTESGEFYNWFAPTVLTALESNPIDVAVSNNKVSILKHAVPFSESILIFSDLTQFILKSTEYLSPTNVSLNVTTEFEADLAAAPVGAGRFVFFGTDNGAHTGIREYFVEVDSETNDAVNITSHIPEYLLGNIKHLAASSNNDVLIVLTDSANAQKIAYVYKFFWQGTNKLQSSWSKWTFDGNILTAEFLQDEIFFVIERGENVYLEKMKLSQDDSVSTMTGAHSVHLDRRVKITTTALYDSFSSSYYGDGNTTDFSDNNSLAYVSKEGELLGTSDTSTLQGTHTGSADDTDIVDTTATFQANGLYSGAVIVNNAKGGSGTINATVSSETTAATSLAAGPPDNRFDTGDGYTITMNKIKQAITRDGFVYVGINFEFSYTFSELMVRQGETENVMTNGRLQVRTMRVLYSNTGYFTMEVVPSNRTTDTYIFNGRIVSASENVLNKTPLDTGSYRFPVLSQSNEVVVSLKNDTFLPSIFQSAEWEGMWHLRSRHIN